MKKFLLLSLAAAVYTMALTQTITSPDQFIVETSKDHNGKSIVAIVVPGKPPENFRMPVADPVDGSIVLTNVPAYDWSFGCSATAGAMMAGYYDRTGYTQIYTGPTNSGVAPINNSIWGTVVINGETRSLCPISATRQGLDGRPDRGHVDDYWIQSGNNEPDPYITNNWVEHTHSDCTGDFMKTNQSAKNNSDGSTTFWYYTDGSPLSVTEGNDGQYGLKLFFESRGYNVTGYYNQFIQGHNGNTLGFTFQNFKQQIDSGRPVIIHVSGHSMLGIGYNESGSVVYLHDTWDYSQHQMTWGGLYAGMQHYGVGVIELQSISYDPCAVLLPVTGYGSNHLNHFSGGGTGVWFNSANNPCGCTSIGTEQVFEFLAPYSGIYSLQVTEANGSVSYLWSSGLCSSSVWNCLGLINSAGQYGSFSWISGNTYYILLDDIDQTQGLHSFYINCPNQPLPFSETFDNPDLPDFWQQTYSGSVPSERWNVNESNEAGGQPYEMRAYWTEGIGTSRLILPPLNTTGFKDVTLTFDQLFDDYGYGCTVKIQSSADGQLWDDEGWSFNSGSGDLPATNIVVSVQNNICTSTYLAFVIEGDHYAFDFWYIDNVQVTGVPAVPEFLEIQNQTIENESDTCFNASQTVSLAGAGTNFIVESGGIVNIIAGNSIVFYEGSDINAGAYLHADITSENEYCSNQENELRSHDELPTVSESNSMQVSDEDFFIIYPNPGNGNFTIECKIIDNQEIAVLMIYNLLGKNLLRKALLSPKETIDVSMLDKGLYLAHLNLGGNIWTKKLIIR